MAGAPFTEMQTRGAHDDELLAGRHHSQWTQKGSVNIARTAARRADAASSA